MEENFYSPPEVARITGLSTKTIRNRIKEGRIEATQIEQRGAKGKRMISFIPLSSIKKVILSRVSQEAIDLVCK